MEFNESQISIPPQGEAPKLNYYPGLKEFDYEYHENTQIGQYALIRKPSIADKNSYVEVHSSDDEDSSEVI